MTACTDYIEPIIKDECLFDSIPKINNNFSKIQNILCDLKQKFDDRIEVRTFFYYGPNADTDPSDGMDPDTTSRPSNLTIETFVNSPEQLNLPSLSKPNDVAYVIYQKTGWVNNLYQNMSLAENAVLPTRGTTNSIKLPLTTQTIRQYPEFVAQQYPQLLAKTPASTNLTNRQSLVNALLIGFGKGRFIPFKIPTKRLTVTVPITQQLTISSDIFNQFAPVFIVWRLTHQTKSNDYIVDLGFPKFIRSQTSNDPANAFQPQNWTTYNI